MAKSRKIRKAKSLSYVIEPEHITRVGNVIRVPMVVLPEPKPIPQYGRQK